MPYLMRYITPCLLVALTCTTAAAQTTTSVPHWRETDTETIWTGRYSNCDYGYYVILPYGVVGHGSKSPNPNDGFAVDPAAPKSTQSFNATESDRYIAVLSFYDVEDYEESTKATLDYYSSLGEIGDEKNVVTLSRRSYSLAGLSATRMEDRLGENSTAIRRDSIIAYRRAGGIRYQFTLQSPEKNYASDEQLFNRIVEGFRLSKLPKGECSND